MAKIKTHVVFPEEVLKEIDKLIGKRGRSSFVVQATKEKLEKEKLEKALNLSKGLWKEQDYPQFGSVEDINKWIDKLRSLDSKRQSA